MAAVFPAAKYRSVGVNLTGTTVTTIITVPDEAAYDVVWIAVADATGHPVDCLIEWVDDSAATNYALPKAATEGFIECMPLRLTHGDQIQVTGAAGSDVTVTYIEYPVRPAGT
jgi:hypothetical protein